MKTLALVLLLAGSSFALADDNLLMNGDFSSGIAHWEGDCHSPDSNDAPPDLSANPASPAAPTGVFIKLRHEDWTKMTQDFDGNVGSYIPASTGMNFFGAFSSPPGKWLVLVSDIGSWRYSTYEFPLQGEAQPDGTLTAIAHVQLNSNDDAKKGLCLIFPPGDGIITIKNVSLVKAQ